MGYRRTSQSNNSASLAPGTARVSVWYRWWCVLIRPGRDDHAAGVDDPVGFLRQLIGLADLLDHVVADKQTAAADGRLAGIHGQQDVGVLN